METTSLGIGTHGNMSAAGELINKSISASNLAYGRKNNAKVAKFYEAVVTMLHSMAADDKLALLGEYGDLGKLNRNHSNLDDVLAETIIINLPASELEMLVKDVKADEAALKKDIKEIRRKKKKKKTSNFNGNAFEDVYGKLAHAKNANQYMKMRKKLIGGFKIPKGMKTVYANLGREIKDILRNFYDKIEVSALAAEMGIDILPDMKDKEVENAIINKTLLYVDLLVGKSKRKMNYSGAIVERAPFDRLLQLTSYSWVTGKPGMSKEDYFRARAQAMAARKEMQARLRLENGRKWFNKPRSMMVRVKANKLRQAIKNGDWKNTGIKNTDLVLDRGDGNKPKLKNAYELYSLASQYHIKFNEKESLEKLTVRIDREITRQKKKAYKTARALDMFRGKTFSVTGKGTLRYKDDENAKIITSLTDPSMRGLKKYIKKAVKDGRIGYNDKLGRYVYTTKDSRDGKTVTTKDLLEFKDNSNGSVLGNIFRAIRYGRKNSLRRKRNEDAIADTVFNKFNPQHTEEEKKLKDIKKQQESAKKNMLKEGKISQLYDNIPVVNTKNIDKGNIGMAVPTLDNGSVSVKSVPSTLINDNISSIVNRVTPVLVVNKGLFGAELSDKDKKLIDNTNKFDSALSKQIYHKDTTSGEITVSNDFKIKSYSKKEYSSDEKDALERDIANTKRIPTGFISAEASILKFNNINTDISGNTHHVTPVFVVNKEPEDLTYSWLSSEFPKYMMGFATDVVAAPMGTGTIARPSLAAIASTSMGLEIAKDAAKLADAKLGGMLGLATGGHGLAKSSTSSFIAGDSPKSLHAPGSYPEQVDIDWKNKSFNVKPVPTYATGVKAETRKDKVTRFSKQERNLPMAVGFSSHVVKFNRKLDGVSGETDIGEAIKVYNVNSSSGLTEKISLDGANVSLIDLVGNMTKQLAVISEQLKGTGSTVVVPGNQNTTPVIISSQTSEPRPSTVFPDSLNSILQGV